MLIDFFFTLKDAKIPVSIKEFLTLLEALQKNVIDASMDDFYYLSRLTMVKDEPHFDKFDRAFAQYFKGINGAFETNSAIPLDWLIKRMERELSDEQKAQLEKFGYDKLMDRLNELLKEQKERHEGGSKWIGTGGTSPFGNGGTNPEGVRIGGKGGTAPASKWGGRAPTRTTTARAPRTNWRSMPPSTPPPATPATSTSRCGRSAKIISRC